VITLRLKIGLEFINFQKELWTYAEALAKPVRLEFEQGRQIQVEGIARKVKLCARRNVR